MMFKLPFAVFFLLLLAAYLESASVQQKDVPVTRVHLVFMNHLDVGYAGYIGNIINEYFVNYFPRAIALAEGLEQLKYGERFIYTTHPWLVSLYVDCPPNLVLAGGVKIRCPSPADIKAFTNAVKNGYITWHAGPMNMQFEMFEPSLANFSLQISADLDKRFGIQRKFRVVSQRDVPGTTQSVVPIFEAAGIEAISVGVNDRTAPPAFPKIFNWKFQNSSIIGLWHKGGYPDNPGPDPIHPGGLSWNDCVTFPGFDEALCFAFRTDNSGPPKSIQEILSNFEVARGQFPDAFVQASTFDDFIAAVQPIKSKLPVITQECGDTWINGIASDPRKVAEFRAIMRLRKKCIESGNCSLSDPRFYNSSRFLVKPAEHTWGYYGASDKIHWTNDQFHKVMKTSGFTKCVYCWQEQRQFSYLAIDALQNHSLAWDLRHELTKLDALKPDLSGYVNVQDKYSDQTCSGFTLQFSHDGAISKLIDPLYKISWASKTNLLGKFVYQTFDDGDFNYFDRHYAWTATFLNAVGKPNMSKNASPVSMQWQTSLLNLYKSKVGCSLIAEIQMSDKEAVTYYGAPTVIYITYNASSSTVNGALQPQIDVSLQWFGKTTTRLAESLNFMFKPTQNTGGSHWMIHKLGHWVDPLNVVLNGSQSLHVIDRGVYYMNDKSQVMEIVSYDAGLVNVLTPDWDVNAFSFPLEPITSVDGVAFNLYNNVWDTNYILWYPFEQRDIDQKFRFTINFSSPQAKYHHVHQQKSQALKFVSPLKNTLWNFYG